jgi:N-acetylneuraminic acid mutarotase
MRRWVVLVLLAACRYGFSEGPSTALDLHVAAPGLTLSQLTARVSFASLDADALNAIPTDSLTATIALPNTSGSLVATIEATDSLGRELVATGTIQIKAGNAARLDVTLGADLPASCLDGSRDGDETDVDCGGSCPACAIGGACKVSRDCVSNACVTTACEPASGPPVWVPIADMPLARLGLAAAPLSDGRIYVFGGGPTDGTPTAEVDAYDPVADTWATAPSLGKSRARASGTAGGDGALYVVGGEAAATPVASVERCAPGATQWVDVAALPVARQAAAAVTSADGTLFAIGGDTDSAVVALLEVYTGTSWVERTPMPTPRANLAAARDRDGHLLAIGGHDEPDVVHYATVEAYDVTANAWTTLPALPYVVSDLAAALGPDNRTYAIGGHQPPSVTLANVVAYRPGAAGWVTVPPMLSGRDSGAATIGADGRIYAFGGLNGTSQRSAEAYGPRFRLSASDGVAGELISFTGDNFAANATVTIYVDNSPVERVTATAGGVLPIATFAVPPLAAGPHMITAIDDRSAYPVTAAFTID